MCRELTENDIKWEEEDHGDSIMLCGLLEVRHYAASLAKNNQLEERKKMAKGHILDLLRKYSRGGKKEMGVKCKCGDDK